MVVKVLKKGIINDSPQLSNIQESIIAIRDSLNVIEGNLIDFVDTNYTDIKEGD